ncbi:hypothetical protein H2199_006112 [Coniosporium tulheliwenetii]|uniref:Uncharacterized protein n=1 Tax=Coniosporium tulheliwenetii TaxID=3383036 RepID=A0ACC2YY02_9PEZI|nr:hypothetical protein H2199_006112 [Cladosporium sp. JES 115]
MKFPTTATFLAAITGVLALPTSLPLYIEGHYTPGSGNDVSLRDWTTPSDFAAAHANDPHRRVQRGLAAASPWKPSVEIRVPGEGRRNEKRGVDEQEKVQQEETEQEEIEQDPLEQHDTEQDGDGNYDCDREDIDRDKKCRQHMKKFYLRYLVWLWFIPVGVFIILIAIGPILEWMDKRKARMEKGDHPEWYGRKGSHK